jgi:hypothetical protein
MTRTKRMNGALALPMLFALVLAFASACGKRASEANATDSAEGELRTIPPPPSQSRTLKQGFTQRPPRDTPGLPPPIPPLLDEGERVALDRKRGTIAAIDRERAQEEINALVSRFEQDSGDGAGERAGEWNGAENRDALLDRLRSLAVSDAKEARIGYATAEALYRSYLFPNDVEAAEREYAGKFVLLEGVVAPHNMLDLADGFKLFEETPYVHDPVLLATDYELSFVRCHLAEAELQKLRDWEEVHILGVVEGKKRGDVVLRRCVVLRGE